MKKERLKIIYEDKDMIVVDKKHNLLTVGTIKEKERTLYHKVLEFEKTKNHKIFIVHRLDKDTSGLVIFAKNEKMKYLLQNNWEKAKRCYIAVVEGKTDSKGTIKSYLKENKAFISYSSNEGKLAITEYKKLNESKSYSLLDINILTGRKNQIRVHMNDIGNPIIGDKKYGSKTNPLNRLGLHAYLIEFNHPITNKLMHFESNIPKEFLAMFKVIDKEVK